MTGTTTSRLSAGAPAEPAESARAGSAPESEIARLTRVVDELWRAEPDVAPSRRSRLFERLGLLEHDLMRLSLQHHADGPVDRPLLDACITEADELRWWWQPTGRDGGRRAA